MGMVFKHLPVMADEVIEGLDIKPDGLYLDGTCGGGGHSFLIAERLSEKGHLICVDQDIDALEAAGKRLECFGDKIEFVHDNFENISAIVGTRKLDGVLLDLGVSSFQLDNAERGFSYMQSAPLDMRMDRSREKSADNIVNEYSAEELARIFRDWGEEKQAKRIADLIVREREKKPIETTGELADLVRRIVPAHKDPHPEKRVFQSVRVETNRELEIITPTLEAAMGCMNPGGRVAVITFHSLEDRLVKQAFAAAAKGCTCPPDFPVCVCGKKPLGTLVNRKPITASDKELNENSRSASAKLRIFEIL